MSERWRVWSLRPHMRAAGLLASVLVVAAALVSPAGAQTLNDVPALALSLSTTKGCVENGDDPVYAVGERITVTLRIGSSSVHLATATLFDILPDHRIAALSLGPVTTNQTFSFAARIGGPTGVEKLVLRADAAGVATQRRSCSFTVVEHVPTRTPTPTRTPPGTASVTRTPGGALEAKIRTNRGCREDGEAAPFQIGEPIVVTFRIDSDSLSRANGAIVDLLPNGSQTVFAFGSVPTNLPFSLVGRVGPPSGEHALRLHATAPGRLAEDTCTFLVAGSAPPTRTRTATRTATPRPATPTPTVTLAPVAGSICVGACAQPDSVSIGDLQLVLAIAAGQIPLSACPSADANGDLHVSLDEVLLAVTNALDGCPVV